MEQQEPTEFILDVFADPRSVREVVKGILHTVFFTRFFPAVVPRTREVLDVSLPYVEDAELETMIDQRASALERQLESESSAPPSGLPSGGPGGHARSLSSSPYSSSPTGGGGPGAPSTQRHAGGGSRGQITVQFFEKRRRKAWLSRGDDEVCWECWTVKVTVAEPRTETERAKVRRAMEQTLRTTAMKIVTITNAHKDHIPPITTQSSNPFPYKIITDQKQAGWAARMRIY